MARIKWESSHVYVVGSVKRDPNGWLVVDLVSSSPDILVGRTYFLDDGTCEESKEENVCKCTLDAIMIHGCKCGYLKGRNK